MLVIQRPTVEAIDEAQVNTQQFAVGPLEPGFGPTLGNSLRRTLLSSVPGAAITEVRFEGADHEFGTLDGVVDDITDMILALKDIVVRSHSDEAVTVRLEVTGPAEATAGDLSPHADIEVLNPDLHLATVNKGGRLSAEVTIERGRGFLSSSRPAGDALIGVIPVDALFSPVRRVAFDVEATQVDQSTDYDRLILTIETDGSQTPRDALASAGGTLRALVQLVEEMSDEPRGLALGEVGPVGGESPDMDLPIEDLVLSERPRNCLKRAQVDTVGELLERTEDDLLAITNFGQKSLDEVLEKLDERGLALRVRD